MSILTIIIRLVSQCHTVLAVPTSDLPICISDMFHKVWCSKVIRVYSSKVLLRGTFYQLTRVHQTVHWTFSKRNW